jgi:protein arginine N-methyltransferase 1
VTKEQLDFSSEYTLTTMRTDKAHALVAWFDTYFDNMTKTVKFSTGPWGDYTHWKQTVFYLERPLKVYHGDEVYGSVACRKSKANFRELDIKISTHHKRAKGGIEDEFVNMFKLR